MPHDPQRVAHEAMVAAFEPLPRVQRHRADQSRTGGDWIKASTYALDCLDLAITLRTIPAVPSIGPLMVCWREKDGKPRDPSPQELADARAGVFLDLEHFK